MDAKSAHDWKRRSRAEESAYTVGYKPVKSEVGWGATWCFVQVFILMGLRGVCFVSVVDAGFTGAELVRNGTIWKNGVDSIGFAEREI